MEGEKVEFKCVISAVHREQSKNKNWFHLYKNREEISSLPEPGGMAAVTFIKQDISKNDAGNYTCMYGKENPGNVKNISHGSSVYLSVQESYGLGNDIRIFLSLGILLVLSVIVGEDFSSRQRKHHGDALYSTSLSILGASVQVYTLWCLNKVLGAVQTSRMAKVHACTSCTTSPASTAEPYAALGAPGQAASSSPCSGPSLADNAAESCGCSLITQREFGESPGAFSPQQIPVRHTVRGKKSSALLFLPNTPQLLESVIHSGIRYALPRSRARLSLL
ncbi:UNVERIFIED_CONTAM: hypothetical protein FKN15_045183 [Acipenser sinensis]